jgi:hypothetical protein
VQLRLIRGIGGRFHFNGSEGKNVTVLVVQLMISTADPSHACAVIEEMGATWMCQKRWISKGNIGTLHRQ